jgi:anti-sigma B factor antagonist/stage II sporulation protein AA (anti-sigma F factor antagonist)
LTLHHPQPGRALVRVHGEVDLGTVDDFRAVMIMARREPVPDGLPGRHVVCDLSGVTFLAAVGVGAVAEAGAAARRGGTHLHLVAPPGPARRVLELCGLDRELPIAARLADVLDQGPPEAPLHRSAA